MQTRRAFLFVSAAGVALGGCTGDDNGTEADENGDESNGDEANGDEANGDTGTDRTTGTYCQNQSGGAQASFRFDIEENAGSPDDYGVDRTDDEDAVLLEISHYAGASLIADGLFNRGGSYENGSWAAGQYQPNDEIGAGDIFRMWMATSDEIRVVWDCQGESLELGSFSGYDA